LLASHFCTGVPPLDLALATSRLAGLAGHASDTE